MGGLFSLLAPDIRQPVPVRRQRGRAGVRLRPLVDGPERGLAARRPAARRVQHDVGASAGASDGRHLRARPHRHPLHRRRRVRVRGQLRSRAPTSPGCPCRCCVAHSSRSAPRRPSSGCSARWCITAAEAAAAPSQPGRRLRASCSASSASSCRASTTTRTPAASSGGYLPAGAWTRCTRAPRPPAHRARLPGCLRARHPCVDGHGLAGFPLSGVGLKVASEPAIPGACRRLRWLCRKVLCRPRQICHKCAPRPRDCSRS